ncbi:hypothetical protein [Bacillus glycinifermentans]|uniref:Uncharacterized protein n=1 Tax=Bacillus glycinifermentans TaxID=1664069 RepID=A0ABU6H502_9BACI|nr:hypothetical protein [Bacillus glycinifermentans]MEC0486077.1 hypothetical protein [Bacillus glycinifermentans]
MAQAPSLNAAVIMSCGKSAPMLAIPSLQAKLKEEAVKQLLLFL